MVLIGSVGAAAIAWWAGGLFQEGMPGPLQLGSGAPETMVSSPLVVRVSEDGPCAIAGETKRTDSHPVYLTALRYERRGATWVVSDFVNVDLGSERAFVIEGLIPGLWFVAAWGFVAEEPTWGRSEAIALSADEPWSRTWVSLESFQVQAVVEGLPEEFADEVYLSMDWEERDRIHVEADEFLDLPNDICPRTNASLHSDPWPAIPSGRSPGQGCPAAAHRVEGGVRRGRSRRDRDRGSRIARWRAPQ